jgi:hypothetical protein
LDWLVDSFLLFNETFVAITSLTSLGGNPA